jgi:hypothetical protein
MTLFGPRKIRDFKNSCWCGWDSLPPGFQFPVKELVASLKDPKGELTKLSFFCIIYKKVFFELLNNECNCWKLCGSF